MNQTQTHTTQTLTIKTLKTWRDHDGGVAYQATLALDGRTVGQVTEDGYGGVLLYNIARPDAPRWTAYLATLPLAEPYQDVAAERIEALVGAFLEAREAVRFQKRLAKACATKTVFRLETDPVAEYRTLNAPFSDRVRQFLVGKYGTAVVILNTPLA